MPGNVEKNSFNWEVTGQSVDKREKTHDLHGVLFLDIDGTLSRPDSMYAIDHEAISVVTEFIDRGGVCIFNTGATLGRLERTILNPIFNALDEKYNNHQTVTEIFRNKVIIMPENGSATLLSTDVEIVENELYFLWHVLHPLHVPNKEELRNVIQEELVPSRKDSFVIGDHKEDMSPRQYILSWKGITNTLELVEEIKTNIIPKHPEIDWKNIQMKAARKTIDFINANSGKETSSGWVLDEVGSLDGPILGFGDLGDEFGRVVPTINVNQGKPNEFRKRGIPAMELTRWELLSENGYIVTGSEKDIKVRHIKTDEEMNVLRNQKGEIIYAVKNEKCGFMASSDDTGYPVEIKPVSYFDKNDKLQEVQDAGKGTAWVLRNIINSGYFNLK